MSFDIRYHFFLGFLWYFLTRLYDFSKIKNFSRFPRFRLVICAVENADNAENLQKLLFAVNLKERGKLSAKNCKRPFQSIQIHVNAI